MEKIKLSSITPDGSMSTEVFASRLILSESEMAEYIRLQKILDKPWEKGGNAQWKDVSTAEEYNQAFTEKDNLLRKSSIQRGLLENFLCQNNLLDWEIHGDLLDPWSGGQPF